MQGAEQGQESVDEKGADQLDRHGPQHQVIGGDAGERTPGTLLQRAGEIRRKGVMAGQPVVRRAVAGVGVDVLRQAPGVVHGMNRGLVADRTRLHEDESEKDGRGHRQHEARVAAGGGRTERRRRAPLEERQGEYKAAKDEEDRHGHVAVPEELAGEPREKSQPGRVVAPPEPFAKVERRPEAEDDVTHDDCKGRQAADRFEADQLGSGVGVSSRRAHGSTRARNHIRPR